MMHLSFYSHIILKSFNFFENIILFKILKNPSKFIKNENFVHVLFGLRGVENDIHKIGLK